MQNLGPGLDKKDVRKLAGVIDPCVCESSGHIQRKACQNSPNGTPTDNLSLPLCVTHAMGKSKRCPVTWQRAVVLHGSSCDSVYDIIPTTITMGIPVLLISHRV